MKAPKLSLLTNPVDFCSLEDIFSSLPSIPVSPTLLPSIPSSLVNSPQMFKLRKQLRRLNSSSKSEEEDDNSNIEDTARKPWLKVLARSPSNRPDSPESSCCSSSRGSSSCSSFSSRNRSHRRGSGTPINTAGQFEVRTQSVGQLYLCSFKGVVYFVPTALAPSVRIVCKAADTQMHICAKFWLLNAKM